MKKSFKTDKLETLCVQGGYTPKSGEPRVAPIVQSTTFYYDTADELAELFDLKTGGYFYSRLGNPTLGVLEEKMCELDGGTGALALASGQSANMTVVLSVCSSGDHIISSSAIYGGTYNLFDVTLRRLGIETTFVAPDACEAEIQAEIRPNTKLIFGETIANPAIKVLDFDNFGKVARDNKILFAVDNTLATPIHCRPLSLGANIVAYSTTKYLDGHATSVGGLIVDGGNFDYFASGRYESFTKPDESYHGLVYARDAAAAPFATKARVQITRDTGAIMSPMNAFLTNLGTETLHLRMERTSENALKVAEFLAASSEVEFVNYPFLKDNAEYENAQKYLTGGAGGMLAIGVKGGRARAERFIAALELFANVTHVADLRSCVLHPASTTHRQLSDAALDAAGVKQNLVRISVGIENVDDLIRDLSEALKKSK